MQNKTKTKTEPPQTSDSLALICPFNSLFHHGVLI